MTCTVLLLPAYPLSIRMPVCESDQSGVSVQVGFVFERLRNTVPTNIVDSRAASLGFPDGFAAANQVQWDAGQGAIQPEMRLLHETVYALARTLR